MIDRSFEALTWALPEPLLLVSGKGEVLAVNRAACRLFEGHGEVAQRKLAELVAESPDKLAQYLTNCSRTRERVPASLTIRTAQGEEQRFRCEGFLVTPASKGKSARILIRLQPRAQSNTSFTLLNEKIADLNREIAHRKGSQKERENLLQEARRTRQTAEEARAEAENANRLKDEFLATVSHELRTPLTAILGWTRLLRQQRVSEDQVEGAMETIERNARAQLQLVDDLLDVSQIIRGQPRLDISPVDLVSVIETVLESIKPTLEAKGLFLSSTLDPDSGPVAGDPERLQQVVWNILSNAVKFTPIGGQIGIHLRRVNSRVEIVVTDTGPGIDATFLPFLFNRFSQFESTSARRHKGLGLGLAIVRHLVELHGGAVRVENRSEGKGAIFTVALPLMAARDP